MTAKQPYVLVADDSRDGREMLAEYLAFRGLRVITTSDGDGALKQVSIERPAVILMDLQMPGMTGWDATRQLKADPQTRDVMVIAVSAHALARDESKARHAGCDAYVPKPFDIVALGNALADVIQRGRVGLASVAALSRPATERRTPRVTSDARKGRCTDPA